MPDRTIQRLFLSCQSALDASPQPLKNRQAISAITQCRTRDLGVSFYACPEGHGRWEHCHSCRHRSCYLCAQKRRLEWIEAQKQRLLDVPHFHVIFTLPHEYLSLWRYNEALFARLLFRASQESLQELLADPKYGRVRPGILMTLHTWGRQLTLHPHTHCLVTAGVLLLGARKGKYGKDGSINAIPGANLPLAALGTFILWMGWFGFNGGSVLKLGDIANANSVAMVFLNTNAAAAGGLIAALIVARMMFGKADLTMALNGALAGLVAITAEPSTPTALGASIIGLVGGMIVVFSIIGLDKLKIDDPVGAISVHGSVGIFGLLVVPLTNDAASFSGQIIGALTIFAWVFVASLIVWTIIKMVMGIRVPEDVEYQGVDIAECGMEAYPEFTRKS